MVLKSCPRCGKLIPCGVAYCASCAPLAAAALEEKRARLAKSYNARYNKKRNSDDPKYRKFRNSKEWKKLSRAKLASCNYLCEAKLPGCKRIACEVHHVEPIRTPQGWQNRFEWDGLRGVCVSCHNILDNKGFRRRDDGDVIDLREVERDLRSPSEEEGVE